MVAVAIVGLWMGGIVGGYRLKRRHDVLLSHYRYHRRLSDLGIAQQCLVRDSAQIDDRITDRLEGRRGGLDMQLGLSWFQRPRVDTDRQTVARLLGITAYHAAMARKYGRAARYPWLPVEPDPPPPGP
jgi:hypothetical protein